MRKTLLILLILIFIADPMCQASVVWPHQIYTVDRMEKDLKTLQETYHFQVDTLGKTAQGSDIWAAKLGKGERSILLVGSHHAREWLTTTLLMSMLEEYAEAYSQGASIAGYSTNSLDDVSIWFVPLLNPDGVRIQQGDFSDLSRKEKFSVWKMNRFSKNWSRWKANANGIDVNRQYPAGWNTLKTGVHRPHYQFYKGKHPLQAEEAKALVSFTKQIDPLIAVAYHTSGREIFWNYHNEPDHIARDYKLAKKAADITGYELAIPEKNANGSGFTDWFITEFQRPAMTIELSFLVKETNPPITVFDEEYKRNRSIGMMLISEANKFQE
jgi:g-D-glutamyl-meso-diaminopimelate peptidase